MYIAHINEDRIQTILEHSNNTAKLCSEFAVEELKEIAYNIGILHDIGKYQNSFQERILGVNIKVEHSTCGAIVADKIYKSNIKYLLEYCIAGHHSGIPNGGNDIDISIDRSLHGRLKRKFEDFSKYEEELKLCEIDENKIGRYIVEGCRNREELIEKYAFLVRYLFSCLTDADTIDTAYFCSDIRYNNLESNFENCLKKLNDRFSKFTCVTELQKNRSKIQNQVYEKINTSSKIYLMNMPTGSGKTLCSMKFALERALKTGKKRIIYIIPYNSIIDQTVCEFEKIFGDDINILRHQSSFSIDEKNDISEDYRNMLKFSMENWNADFIVTTAVQFFESMYSNKRSRLRKLHNMQDSILIFDEAHLMPKEFLQPCLRGIYYITKYLNSESIFLTATMPNFKELLRKYVSDDCNILDLVNDRSCFSKFEKCSYEYIGEQNNEELLSDSLKNPSTLIIVNKRSTARELYKLCKGKKYHLSTYMTAFDRERIIAEIKYELRKLEEDYSDLDIVPEDRRITVISTSLIEAGVDLDFYSVYRELTGLDSILQAGGRCNREGKRKNSIVKIFELTQEKYKSKNDDGASNICLGFINENKKLSEDKVIEEYYQKLLFLQHDKIIKNSISNKSKDIDSINFEEYSENFEIIRSNTISIVVPRDIQSQEIVNEMKYTHIANIKKLQRYTATIYEKEFDDLLQQHVLEDFDSGVYCLTNLDYYDPETGILFDGKDYII